MDFKITTELIGEYLARFGFAKFALEDEANERVGFVRTGWRGDAGTFVAIVDPQEQHGVVRLIVPEVIEIPEDAGDERVAELSQYLLHLNAGTLIGAASLPFPSRRVAFSIPLVVRDSELTYEVFEFAFRGLIHIAEDIARNARRLLAGESVFDETSGRLQATGVPEMTPELMKEFRAWLERQGNRDGHDA